MLTVARGRGFTGSPQSVAGGPPPFPRLAPAAPFEVAFPGFRTQSWCPPCGSSLSRRPGSGRVREPPRRRPRRGDLGPRFRAPARQARPPRDALRRGFPTRRPRLAVRARGDRDRALLSLLASDRRGAPAAPRRRGARRRGHVAKGGNGIHGGAEDLLDERRHGPPALLAPLDRGSPAARMDGIAGALDRRRPLPRRRERPRLGRRPRGGARLREALAAAPRGEA